MATGDSRKIGPFLSSPISSKGSKHLEHYAGGDVLTVVVDGRTFTVNRSLFTRYPNTMLGRFVGEK